MWSSSVCSACKDHCIISRGKLEHIDKPERRARSSVWDTKQIHAPVTDGQSASRSPEKAREDTRCVCFHGTELRLVNASPCLQSSAVSVVSLSRRLTATCAQPRAFTCWWSPLLCTWLKTLACWHGARFSGETGGGSVAAFSRQPAATWWSTGTNSSGAACALQTSPPSATRLISYITKVGGKWKTLWGWKWCGGLFAHISHPTCQFVSLCSGFICCWNSSVQSAFSLSVDVCATLMVTCLCLASLRVNISTDSTHTSIRINHSFF